jgi:transposase-like protein
VEVDETYIGGEEPGLRGGRARGKRSSLASPSRCAPPKGTGRCRMAVLLAASQAALTRFVTQNVQPGSTVITDGWHGYRALPGHGYAHEPHAQKAARARGADPGEPLPAVHRVASLAKQWLLGTHQGPVDRAHLQSYLNEFTFRFKRRRSRSRGMVFYRVLELAAGHPRFATMTCSPPSTRAAQPGSRPLPEGTRRA